MRIYRISSDASYRCLCWNAESLKTDQLEGEFVRQFRTGAKIDNWVPPPIRLMTQQEDISSRDEGKKKRIARAISDSPFYSAATIFVSSTARDALHVAIKDCGQFLPVPIPDHSEGLFVFNCTTVLDALDRDKSDIEFYSSGAPRSVRSHAFHADVIRDIPIFRLHWPQTYAIYVSQAVVNIIADARLTGFVTVEAS